MSERPILFSGPMVRAILAGKKTQTRRLVAGADTECISAEPMGPGYDRRDWFFRFTENPKTAGHVHRCRYGSPGDTLWVRETWYDDTPGEQDPNEVHYRADHDCRSWEAGCPCRDDEGRSSWRPSIHMPRWASRITLRVTSVRVERLHAITEEGARAEGVTPTEATTRMATRHLDAFRVLWGEINGAEAWDANPWVWVVSFEREVSPCR